MDTKRRELATWEAHAELATLRFHLRHERLHDVLDTVEGLLIMCKCPDCKGTGWIIDERCDLSEYDRTMHTRKLGESQHAGKWQMIINKDREPVARFICERCKCRGSVIQPWAVKVRHALRWALDAVAPLATTLHLPEIERLIEGAGLANFRRAQLDRLQALICLYDVSTATQIFKMAIKLMRLNRLHIIPLEGVANEFKGREYMAPSKLILIRIANLVTMLPREPKPTCHQCGSTLSNQVATATKGCTCRATDLGTRQDLDTFYMYCCAMVESLGECFIPWLRNEWKYVSEPGVKITKRTSQQRVLDEHPSDQVTYDKNGHQSKASAWLYYQPGGELTVRCWAYHPCPPLPKYVVPEA